MSSSILASLYPEVRAARTELNRPGEAHARSLIKAGKINTGEWSFTAEEGDKLLGADGKDFAEYGKWHLGVDPGTPEDTREHYRYPFGKNGEVYLEALRAIRSRSAQQKAQGVFAAAGALLALAEPKNASKERLLLPPGYERRCYAGEIRLGTNTDTGQPIIQGYASVYGTLSEDLGGFRERANAGCFRSSLESGKDVRAFFNHEPTQIVARRSAGNLRLFDGPSGLRYEIDPPDTTAGRDLTENIRCGNVRESSFGFNCRSDKWSRDGTGDKAVITRDLVDADLFDVSPVVFPAYSSSTATLRSLDVARAQFTAPTFSLSSYLDWLTAIDAAR